MNMMNRLFDEGKKLKCFSCFDLKKEDRNFNHSPHRKKSSRKKHHSRGEKTSQNCSGIIGSKKNSKGTSSGPKNVPQKNSAGNNVSVSPTSFTFQELANATKNFSSECLLREEDFGSLYKGTLANRQIIAVKKLEGNARECNMRLLIEVLILNCLTHPNIVKMIGYCSDGDRRLLIYEYLPMRLLKDRLHDLPMGKEPLDWTTRMKIAAGAAKALEYLHDKAKPQVIFRDFKPSCVLLDDEDCSPKLYNFGLAKICSIKNEPHKIVGTQGYCAPESMEPAQLSVKSDLYSFGVVLLELITGRKAIDTAKPEGEQRLLAWAKPFLSDPKSVDKLADPRMEGKFPRRGLFQALAVASVCIREDPTCRPPIGNVVTALTYLVNQSNRPDEDNINKNYEDSLNKEDDSNKLYG